MNQPPGAVRAFARYHTVGARLPGAAFLSAPRNLSDLSDVVDDFDVFVLVSYGALNAGPTPIPGGLSPSRRGV